MIALIGSHFHYLAMAAGGCFAAVMLYVSIEEALSSHDQ